MLKFGDKVSTPDGPGTFIERESEEGVSLSSLFD
jgi:hypothetical protein